MAFSKPARPCALLVPFQESQGGDGMSFPGCVGATPSFPAPQRFAGWFPAKAGGCLPFLGEILPHFLGSPSWVIQSSPQLLFTVPLLLPRASHSSLAKMLWPGWGSRDPPLLLPTEVKPLGLLA